MCTKFLSKVLSYESGRGNLTLFSPGRYFLCSVKNYPFLRTAATVASEISHKDGAESTEHPSLITPLIKNYFVKYFSNKEEYRSLIFDRNNLHFETEGRPESVHILKNLTDGSEDEELIGKLKSSLLKEKEILHVEEICKSLFWTYKHKGNNLAKEIASLLEEELLNRKLSKSEILNILFTLNQTWGRGNRKSFLQKKLATKIFFKIPSLSPEQCVVLFLCKLTLREDLLKLINYNVIEYVTNIIPSLDSVELGIIAKGLLVGNFSCYSYPLKMIVLQRAKELSGSMNEIPLVSICKFLKENITYMDGPDLLEFQESLVPHISKYNHNDLNNLIAVGVKIGCLNSNLWETVAKIFKENINDYDLKKVMRVVSIKTDCDIVDEELLKLAIEKFERAVEDGTIDYAENRKHLIFLLNNLIHHRIYPKKLLDVVFAEGLTFFPPGVKYGSHARAKYWETKCFLDIDKPEFNYNSFSEEEAAKLFKMSKYVLANFNESPNYCNNLFYALKTMTASLVDSYGDEEKVYSCAWHPVYPKGVFLRFDKNLNAQPIPADFKSANNIYPKKALKDDHIWAFVALLPLQYCFGTEKLKLRVLTQIRHLEAFGYQPILVQYNSLRRHIQENKANEYLNDLINKQLHKTS